jgi:two-component sensor histidine kinase
VQQGNRRKRVTVKMFTADLRLRERFDSWLRDYPRATPIAIFCIAFTLVLLASWSVEAAQQRIRLAGWQANASDIASAIERQAASDRAYLEATSALFAGVENASPDFFRRFADRLRLIYDLNGVLALGWAERVEPNDLPALKMRMEEGGFPEFTVLPRPDSGDWPAYVITMLEPQTWSNRALIGHDMHAEPRRAKAMERALMSNDVAATDRVKLFQDATQIHAPAFIAFAPVWSVGPERRFRGFVFMQIRASDFIATAVPPRLLESGKIEIVDETETGPESIFSASPPVRTFADPLQERVTVFDQHWVLRFSPPRRMVFPLTLVILVGGTAFALLLLAYVLLVQRRNGDLQALLEAQTERETERAAFVRELNHRVKNSLANVTSIISLTRQNAKDLDSYADMLLRRVRALAASHSLLDGAQWGPTDLRSLVLSQTGSDERIVIDGPPVLISPNDALTVGLALHELLTNATRHGALTDESGKVTISWSIVENECVEVDWRESGGPPIAEPKSRGFGLNLIERALALELGRKILVEFAPEGLHCQFRVNLRPARRFKLRQ